MPGQPRSCRCTGGNATPSNTAFYHASASARLRSNKIPGAPAPAALPPPLLSLLEPVSGLVTLEAPFTASEAKEALWQMRMFWPLLQPTGHGVPRRLSTWRGRHRPHQPGTCRPRAQEAGRHHRGWLPPHQPPELCCQDSHEPAPRRDSGTRIRPSDRLHQGSVHHRQLPLRLGAPTMLP